MAKKCLNLGYGVPCPVQLHSHKMPDGMKAKLRDTRTLAEDLNKVECTRQAKNLRPGPCLQLPALEFLNQFVWDSHPR